MADEDGKIRRNLVMVSSAILLSAWLDIPFSALIGKLVDAKYAAPETFRVWIVGFVVLIYLGIRYTFSEEGAHYRSAISDEVQRKVVDRAIAMAQRQADRYTRTGNEPAVFDGKFIEFVRTRASEEMPKGEIPGGRGRPIISLRKRDDNKDPWNFHMSPTFAWPDGSTSSGGQAIEVKITGRHRLFVQALAQIQIGIYSQSSIKYLVPVVLALLAVLTLFYKVFQAYSASI